MCCLWVACAGCRCGVHTRSSRRRLFVAGRGLIRSRARTRPSGRRLFVAGRRWVPSERALVHPDGSCSAAAGAGFAAGGAHVRPDGRWCCFAPVLVPWFVAVGRALWVCGTPRPLLLGTCPCALVVAGGVPLWRASWPRMVRRALSGLVTLGDPVGFLDAVCLAPPRGLAPPALPGGCAGHVVAG